MVEGKGERWNESDGAIGESYKVIFEEADPEKEGAGEGDLRSGCT